MIDISVIVPGIRYNNWGKLCDSIKASTKRSYEVIFIGPTRPEILPDEAVFIQDFGSPIRCQQIGLLACKGKYLTWAADDGEFLEGALDIAFEKVSRYPVVMGKYLEGDSSQAEMSDLKYYKLNYHEATRSKFTDYLGLNIGLIDTKLVKDIGGWDCQFEVCPMAHADMASRLQNIVMTFDVQDEIMFKCTHTPGTTGDHGPIHYAQITHDEPLFKSIWNSPECLKRIKIDINNWKLQPPVWRRRFS